MDASLRWHDRIGAAPAVPASPLAAHRLEPALVTSDAVQPTRLTLYRDAGSRAGAFVRNAWRRRWVKVVAILLAIPIVFYFLLWLIFARGLPSAETLLTYQPPLPTQVRDIDGA